jgi:hypothetical protein
MQPWHRNARFLGKTNVTPIGNSSSSKSAPSVQDLSTFGSDITSLCRQTVVLLRRQNDTPVALWHCMLLYGHNFTYLYIQTVHKYSRCIQANAFIETRRCVEPTGGPKTLH